MDASVSIKYSIHKQLFYAKKSYDKKKLLLFSNRHLFTHSYIIPDISYTKHSQEFIWFQVNRKIFRESLRRK